MSNDHVHERDAGPIEAADSWNSRPFRLALEASPTAMLLIDQHGCIVFANHHAGELFGYWRDELLGMSVDLLVPVAARAKHPGHRADFFHATRSRKMGGGRELYGLRKDGVEIPIEVGLNPLETADGRFVLSSIIDVSERKRATEQFRMALEAAPTGMIMIDARGVIVLVNAQIEKLFGYTRGELIGRTMEMLVPVRSRAQHPGFRTDYFAHPDTRPMGAGRELFGLRKDGVEIPLEIGLNPLSTQEGSFVLSSVVDITDRKRAEREREQLLALLKRLNNDLELRVEARTAELTAALKEREVLLQEVHHRVKNNLQVISSLINMQVRRMDDRTSMEALRECQLRVQAIALIHEKLYQSKDYARVPLSDYVRSLAGSVFYATGTAASRVNLDFQVEELWLAVDKAIPCGLLLNELITNSLKHGFRDGRSGTIRVELARQPGDLIRLAVRDNGIGLPSSFQLTQTDSLGLQLVSTLTEQLDGELAVHGNGGASFELLFKAA